MPRLLFDWSSITDADFKTQSNSEIARRLGTSPQNVRKQRYHRGIKNRHHPGGWRGDPLKMKPSVRISARAQRHLRTLAAAAGMDLSAFILSLPLPVSKTH